MNGLANQGTAALTFPCTSPCTGSIVFIASEAFSRTINRKKFTKLAFIQRFLDQLSLIHETVHKDNTKFNARFFTCCNHPVSCITIDGNWFLTHYVFASLRAVHNHLFMQEWRCYYTDSIDIISFQHLFIIRVIRRNIVLFAEFLCHILFHVTECNNLCFRDIPKCSCI